MRKYQQNGRLFNLLIVLFLYMSTAQADDYADCSFTLSGTPFDIQWYHNNDNVQTTFGAAIRHGPEDNSKQRTWIEVQTKDQKNLFTLAQKDSRNHHIWTITGEKIDGVSLSGASVVTCKKICTFPTTKVLTQAQLDSLSHHLTGRDFNPPSELEKIIKSCSLL
ncbi:MAG TPA: hypothetical protein VKR58_00095 [Aquella sp.]|nr:hypothetical protein [Aquella sp.]